MREIFKDFRFRHPDRVLLEVDARIDQLTHGTGLEGLDCGQTLDVLDTNAEVLKNQLLANTLEIGKRAMEKCQSGDRLSNDDMIGLEAIVVLYGRPALLIQDDDFETPPGEWEKLNNHRDEIRKVIRSVGRIEVKNHPRLDWIGTAFVVADDLVLTNEHVAREFASTRSDLSFVPNLVPSIDFRREHDRPQIPRATFTIQNCVAVHPKYDAALLRIERLNDSDFPEPLVLQSYALDDVIDREVYVIGYPAWDGRRNDRVEMLRIFHDIFNVKRLQPGYTRDFVRLPHPTLTHDCSTLGGNSGSCVVDLNNHTVIGLHFAGRYLERNSAVPLWELTRDGFLER